ncbi:MAG: tail fiber domain-containing protein, partial [Ferruginibacter sp.]
IYGEFDNKLVKVFGSLEINTANYDVDIPTIRFTNRQFNGDWKIQAKAGPNTAGSYSFNELTFNTSQSDFNAPLFKLNGTGTLWTTGAMYASSDKRLKKNIVPLNNTLQKLLTLQGYTYNWIDSTKAPEQQIGVMAQEVELVYPQLVSTDKRGYKSVAYANMVPVLLESIKEQQAMIEALKDRTITLQKSNDDILKRLAALEAKN